MANNKENKEFIPASFNWDSTNYLNTSQKY